MRNAEPHSSSFLEKVAAFIVDKPSLICLLTTKQGLNIMHEQFVTYGTAEIMVANITPDQAAALEPKIKAVKGVQSVDYDETPAHYNDLSALFSVTFAYSEDDDACLDSLSAVKELLTPYDLYIKTDLGNTQQETIELTARCRC